MQLLRLFIPGGLVIPTLLLVQSMLEVFLVWVPPFLTKLLRKRGLQMGSLLKMCICSMHRIHLALPSPSHSLYRCGLLQVTTLMRPSGLTLA